MKRYGITSKIAALVTALAIALLGGVANLTASADDIVNTPYNINFSLGTNASQIRFTWFSPVNNNPEVQIAKTADMQGNNFPSGPVYYGSVSPVNATIPGNSNQQTKDSVTGYNEYVSKVTVNGLTPSTKYTYRVGDGKTWSGNYSFTTGNTDNGFSFAAFGDPQIGSFDNNKKSSNPHANLTDDQKGWADTLSKVMANYPSLNFLFTLGDQVNDYGDLAKQQNEYKAFLNPDPNQNYLQKYPLVTLEGNHDLQMGTYYSFHYNQPNLSTLGSTSSNNVNNKDGDYWFTYGNVLFMVLNSNNASNIEEHDQFMQQAVAANPKAKWKVAAWHQSAYSEASHTNGNSPDDPILFIRQNWPKLMDKYGVDIVLQGHDHSYTRSYQIYGGAPVNTTKTNSVTDPKGTVYFTLDSGSGSKYYDFKSDADHSFSSVFWQQYAPTYSYITMNDSKFTINTIRTDTGASIDTYSITKTAASSAGDNQNGTPGSNGSGDNNPGNGNGAITNPKTGDNTSNEWPMIAASLSGLIILITLAAFLAKKKTAQAR